MDNVNAHKEDSKLENNTFNEELKRMIEQIKSIREIEWRTDIEEDKNLKEIKVDLKGMKKDLSELLDKMKAGQDVSADSTKTKQQEKERGCKEQFVLRCIKSICYWLTALVILAVFTFNAVWLVIKAGSSGIEPCNTIPFIAGGVLILLFLAIIVIVLACRLKFIMGCKDKAEDE